MTDEQRDAMALDWLRFQWTYSPQILSRPATAARDNAMRIQGMVDRALPPEGDDQDLRNAIADRLIARHDAGIQFSEAEFRRVFIDQ